MVSEYEIILKINRTSRHCSSKGLFGVSHIETALLIGSELIQIITLFRGQPLGGETTTFYLHPRARRTKRIDDNQLTLYGF